MSFLSRLLPCVLASLCLAACQTRPTAETPVASVPAPPPVVVEAPAKAAPVPEPAPAVASVQVVRAEFGIFKKGKDGRTVFQPTRTVPHQVGQSYGWALLVRTDKPRVKWREEFTLPTKPRQWRAAPNDQQKVSADQRTSTLERVVAVEQGLVSNGWAVVRGDPKGPHRIRVTVEDAAPVEFEFTIE